jgi:hypothetical protein
MHIYDNLYAHIWCIIVTYILEMEVMCSSETLESFHQTILCKFSEDHTMGILDCSTKLYEVQDSC